jgi:hypothetical protein
MNFHEAFERIPPELYLEQIEVDRAIGALKYGKFNEKAAEVEARVRAEFRANFKQEEEEKAQSAKGE